ncbi:MAG: aminotransferase class IV [Dokdonella sp.]
MSTRLLLNGGELEANALTRLALLNYGHFTTMQVRGRAVRGLDLHLQRLQQASELLFGHAPDEARLRQDISTALHACADASLRVTVFAGELDRAWPERTAALDVLVSVDAPRDALTAPLTTTAVLHQRTLPTIKHVGTFDLWHRLRQARLRGFDDVVLLTPQREIAEGSLWNIGFREGERVVWPLAPALDGVTRRILDAQLQAHGVETCQETIRVEDLPRFRSAFALNAGSPARPIRMIDEQSFQIDDAFSALLARCYEAAPWQPIRSG